MMPSFDYRAVSSDGAEHKGQLTADSAFSARNALREQGLLPVSIAEMTQHAAVANSSWPILNLWRHQLPLKDLVLFTRQLATLLEGGLPLAQVLSILAAQSESKRLRRLVTHVHGKVQEGLALAAALRTSPYVLPDDVVAMIEAGESSGNLTAVMARLADSIEIREQVAAQMKGALFYPIMMLTLSLVIVVFLLAVVVPKVVVMFTHMKQELPLITRILISTSDWLANWWGLVVVLLLLLVIAMKWTMTLEVVRYRWHSVLLHLPLIGKMVLEGATARWSRTLSVLLSSGVPAVDALKISAQVVNVLPLTASVEQMSEQVREGVPLYRALATSSRFPSLVRYLVESGEASGRLSDMLARAAHHYEVSTQARASSLVKLIEPMLILVMGGVVLSIVMAILLPIFAMNQLVG
jgi:general secretion pathway protein F